MTRNYSNTAEGNEFRKLLQMFDKLGDRPERQGASRSVEITSDRNLSFTSYTQVLCPVDTVPICERTSLHILFALKVCLRLVCIRILR